MTRQHAAGRMIPIVTLVLGVLLMPGVSGAQVGGTYIGGGTRLTLIQNGSAISGQYSLEGYGGRVTGLASGNRVQGRVQFEGHAAAFSAMLQGATLTLVFEGGEPVVLARQGGAPPAAQNPTPSKTERGHASSGPVQEKNDKKSKKSGGEGKDKIPAYLVRGWRHFKSSRFGRGGSFREHLLVLCPGGSFFDSSYARGHASTPAGGGASGSQGGYYTEGKGAGTWSATGDRAKGVVSLRFHNGKTATLRYQFYTTKKYCTRSGCDINFNGRWYAREGLGNRCK